MQDDIQSELFIDSTVPSARKQRLFEAGQMKLLVLHLIAQAPKYGYDLMKDIADIVGGGYSPSAGTIYPTLNYLEQQQYILQIWLITIVNNIVLLQQGNSTLNCNKQILIKFFVVLIHVSKFKTMHNI